MWPTAEIRWFQPGPIPPDVQDWLSAGGRHPEHQPVRTDLYLRNQDCGTLGIKLREGRLEVKQQDYQWGLYSFHARVGGAVQAWRKWSFPLLTSAEGPDAFALPQRSWTRVTKERFLCRYALAEDDRVLSLPPGAYPRSGCGLELAALSLDGHFWWTLALEAYGGNDAVLFNNLKTVGDQVFTKGLPPLLQASNSYSYPQWLVRV